MEIVLGVGGGIAAYKAALLLRLMTEAGHGVTVVPTANALEFVGTATWEALSGRPVRTGTFEAVDEVNHVRLGRQPTSWSSPRPPPTCSPARPRAWPRTCSATCC